MTIGYVQYGVDFKKNYPWVSSYNFSTAPRANVNQPNKIAKTDETVFTTNNGETCTDGKDDGKIGFFSAAWNAVKGAAKTVVNGVKGMFTDGNGKFSLKKTLISVATAAVCIAVPAVGVAACVVGGVMGTVQFGKGVYNAATAKTDAEAKEAWQNIGGGIFTVATSVAGAKSCAKAMSKSSSATNGLSSLKGKNVSAKDYAKAFLNDAKSSTKNNVGKLKTSANNIFSSPKEIATNLKSKTATTPKLGTLYKNSLQKAANGLNKASAKLQTLSEANILEVMKSGAAGVGTNARAILSAMKQGVPADSLIAQYGYENVLQVVQAVSGYAVADQAV